MHPYWYSMSEVMHKRDGRPGILQKLTFMTHGAVQQGDARGHRCSDRHSPGTLFSAVARFSALTYLQYFLKYPAFDM